MACVAIAPGSEVSPGKQTAQKFEAETRRKILSEYLLFLPSKHNEDLQRRWPLILYQHGGSLRGNDVNKLRTLGLTHRLAIIGLTTNGSI